MVVILVDDFDGNSQEFYKVVAEEVRKKEVPGVEIELSSQTRGKGGGWFSGTETVSALTVADRIQRVVVIAEEPNLQVNSSG